jgi:hypothetical protein
VTYQNSRIIWYIRLRLLVLFLFLSNLDVLDITSSKDDIAILGIGGRYEIFGWTTFGAERVDIFQGDSRLLRIDFVKGAYISNLALRYEVETLPAEDCQHQR